MQSAAANSANTIHKGISQAVGNVFLIFWEK
jgi:hypothetical protein